MEQIRQAVERAKASVMATAKKAAPVSVNGLASTWPQNGSRAEVIADVQAMELDRNHLESGRLIAHSVADPRSSSFDMLRTQVLQAMDQHNWQFLAVTSPTAGCGKTVTAINLALSMARLPERSVFLVDMDLQRPRVLKSLGLTCQHGLLSVLDGRAALADAVIPTRIDSSQVLVLPTEAPMYGSAELIASRAMGNLLQTIKRDYRSEIVILDMPPMLTGDDVLAILPQIDCILLVAAVGTSTVSEIKQCSKHLQASEVVRVVLNKTPDTAIGYA